MNLSTHHLIWECEIVFLEIFSAYYKYFIRAKIGN